MVVRTTSVSSSTFLWDGDGPSLDAPDLVNVSSAVSAKARTYRENISEQ